MEDDEEIHSHLSPPADETEEEEAAAVKEENDDDHGSPVPSSSSPQPNGRITVTVASPAPPHPSPSTAASLPSTTTAAGVVTPHHNSLTLALPIQTPPPPPPPPPPSSSGKTNPSGGGREDCWSEGATAVLIDAWGERFVELSRGNLKQKHWQEVAEIVSAREGYSKPAKTDVQCKNRIDTVKKKYKSEKAKISSSSSSSPSKWRFFDRLDMLIGPSSAANATKVPPHSSSAGYQRVPVGIPVGRPIQGHGYHHLQPQQEANSPFSSSPQNYGRRLKRPAGSESPDSTDSLPPGVFEGRKRPRADQLGSQTDTARVVGSRGWSQPEEEGGGGAGAGERGGEVAVKKSNRREKAGLGSSLRELTKVIVRFGEAYEEAEGAKLQQMVEMEKQRMKFAKELELQRMKFLMKTQMELSQLTRRPASAAATAVAGVANHPTHTATTPARRNVEDNNNNNNNNNMDSSD